MSTMDFDIYDDRARKVSGYLAHALYESWTSDQNDVADYRMALQVLLTMSFKEALKVTYRLSEPQVTLVRDLLSEYGLHDLLSGSTRSGLEGLIEFVVTNPANHRS